MSRGAGHQEIDSLLAAGDQAFTYEQYDVGIAAYEALLAREIVQERMLYRLAYMYEQRQDHARAIFVLRQVQQYYGGDRIDDKVSHLMTLRSPERLPAGAGFASGRLWLARHIDTLWVALPVATLLAVLCWVAWRRRAGWWGGLVAASLALALTGLLAWQRLAAPVLAVVLVETACYESPSFAANYRFLPIGPGATVQVLDTHDTWCRVRLAPFETWIPAHTLRQLTP
ncbi:MAG: hypothetical protein OHK0039_49050 [Bacteroidia bacterium]